MKKITTSIKYASAPFWALTIVLFLTAFVAIPQATAKEPIVLKLSYPQPAPGFHGQGYTFFGKAVAEESNGEVEIKTYPSGSLVSDPEALDAVMQGNVDIANFMVAYLTPTIKELTPFEIPGVYPGEKFWELQKETQSIVQKIFAKYGVKYLGMNDQDTITFAANKKVGKPISLPSDMKGLTVRTPGRWGGEAIKLWGGSPVTVPLGDLAVALERGTIMVSYTGWIITGPFKLYESAPYVTMTKLQEMFAGLMMSEKAWKGLNPSQQAAIERAAQRWMDFSHQLSGNLKQKFIATVKESGGEIYQLPDANEMEFRKVTKPLLEEVAKISGPEGGELIPIFAKLRGE